MESRKVGVASNENLSKKSGVVGAGSNYSCKK